MCEKAGEHGRSAGRAGGSAGNVRLLTGTLWDIQLGPVSFTSSARRIVQTRCCQYSCQVSSFAFRLLLLLLYEREREGELANDAGFNQACRPPPVSRRWPQPPPSSSSSSHSFSPCSRTQDLMRSGHRVSTTVGLEDIIIMMLDQKEGTHRILPGPTPPSPPPPPVPSHLLTCTPYLNDSIICLFSGRLLQMTRLFPA